MSTRKRLLGNMLSLGAVQVFSYLLPFLSLPYLARVLGPTDLGRMAFAISVAQVFVILTDYGFNLSGPKAIALVRDKKDQITDIWCAVTFLRAVFAALGLALICTLLPWLGRMHASWDLILIAYLLVIGKHIVPPVAFSRFGTVALRQPCTDWSQADCFRSNICSGAPQRRSSSCDRPTDARATARRPASFTANLQGAFALKNALATVLSAASPTA